MFYRALVSTTALAVFVFSGGPVKAQANFSNNPLVVNVPNASVPQPNDSASALSNCSITGNIRTLSNAPVDNARVELRDVRTGISVAFGYTGMHGSFAVENVQPGVYELVATSGLAEARQEIRLDGMPVQITVRLPISTRTNPSEQQTVSVQALRTPHKAIAALEKAQSAASKGKIDDAQHEIAKALEIYPQYSDAVAYRGILEMQTGDIKGASNDFQQAIQLDNNNAMAYIAMGSLYNLRNQYDDALRELDRGVTINPSAWQAHYEMSKAHLGKGDFSAALRDVDKAQQLGGHDFGLMHVVKGKALFGIKAYAAAVAEFQKFLQKDTNSPEAAQVREVIARAQASQRAVK